MLQRNVLSATDLCYSNSGMVKSLMTSLTKHGLLGQTATHRKLCSRPTQCSLLAVFALCLQSACSLSAYAEQPPLPSPSIEAAIAEKTQALSLEECLHTALEKNPSIVRAKEKVAIETGRRVQTRAGFLPRLDLDASISKTDKGLIPQFNDRRFGTDRNWSTRLSLSQTLFAGGRIESTYARQRYIEKAALLQLAATINNELFSVKKIFLAALLAREQLKVQQENVALLAEELRLERARLSAGTVSKFNVLRAEVALANAQTPLIRAQNKTRTSLLELERALGIHQEELSYTTSLDIKGSVQYTPINYEHDAALTQALEHRAELQSMELMVKASREGIDIAWSEFLPTITASVDYRAQNNQFSDNIRDDFHGMVTGAQVQWNLFDGLSTVGKIEEARANKRDALAQRNDARAMIRLEVKKAISGLEEAQALFESSKKVVTQAKESLRLAKARFDAGASSQIDVLETQVALTEARTNEVQSLYEYENAKMELKRSLGTDLSIEESAEAEKVL